MKFLLQSYNPLPPHCPQADAQVSAAAKATRALKDTATIVSFILDSLIRKANLGLHATLNKNEN
jgi:hypothetical protein